MKTYCIISVLVFWWSLQLPGQVDVQWGGNFSDDEWLATEVLSSEGVFVSNVRSYGYEEQFGYFSSGQEILGMPSGVMMTNGSVSTLNQGMTTQQTELDVTPLGGEGDDDLLDVANEVPDLINESFTVSVTHDAAILEFDFISISDTVEFSFVFASEEYPKGSEPGFLKSKFNDVFGFFVAGPGITGTYSSPSAFPDGSANLATIPENNWPITVSTVNAGESASYYGQYPGAQSVFPFNGQTIKITKSFKVVPCEVYHFKFALADAQDKKYESGVFLEEVSFKIKKAIVEFPDTDANGGKLFEGCSSLDFVINLPASEGGDQSVDLRFSPTSVATAADFEDWSSTLILPDGVRTRAFSFPVANDLVMEGDEPFALEIELEHACAPIQQSGEYRIKDYEPIAVSFVQTPAKLDCPNTPVDLQYVLQGGFGDVTSSWRVGQEILNQEQLSFSALPTDSVFLLVGDDCQASNPFYWEPNIEPGTLPIVTAPRDTALCVSDTLRVRALKDGGYGTTTVEWIPWGRTGDSLVLTEPDLDVFSKQGEKITVKIIDACNLSATDTFRVAINNPDASFSYEVFDNFLIHATNTTQGNYDSLFWRIDGETFAVDEERIVFQLEHFDPVELSISSSDTGQCASTYSEILELPIRVYVPNAFTPNGDGFNDVFQIGTDQQFSLFELVIFDRLGRVVFETDAPEVSWDGVLPNGKLAQRSSMFVWQLKLQIGNKYSRNINGQLVVM